VRDVDDIIAAGFAGEADRAALEAVGRRYAVAVPPALRALIRDPDGPIGRQFLPHPDELILAPHESADPIGDDALSPLPGLVHRYPDRVLLKPLLICPTYCRFCFRREHVGPGGGVMGAAALEAAYDYVAARPAVREVILTGGDPLMLAPRRLAEIVRRLSAIGHLDLLRVHTRVPVADPARLDARAVAALETDKAMFVVLHTNHAEELTAEAGAAVRRVQAACIPVLSQTVLLRGVNDSTAALRDLFLALLRLRVKPYYLHQLDPAPGTARFHVPIEEGRELLGALRGQISGLAFPTYVFDTALGKRPIGP
jgi:lysine 2,3-aminomutase